MERRTLALLCAGVMCFWLFALAFGTAQGRGLSGAIQTAQPAAAEPNRSQPAPWLSEDMQ